MRYIADFFADFFALVGFVSTIVVVGFYMGYATYHPPCVNPLAVFTKECK
jgi:hypothetical protein